MAASHLSPFGSLTPPSKGVGTGSRKDKPLEPRERDDSGSVHKGSQHHVSSYRAGG
jgi:hypothetical protein